MPKKGHHRIPGGYPPGGRGGPGVPSPQQLARQVAEMRAMIDQQRAALAQQTFTGTAGGGMVRVVVRGTGELVSVSIDPAVLDPADPEMVGDLVVAAVNVARQEAQAAASSSLGIGPAGLDPGALGLGDLRGLLG